MFWLTNYLIVIVQVVYRGGFYVGNGINWKGQIFSKMHNHTVTNKMTVCLFLFHLLAITLEKWEGFKLSVFMLLYIFIILILTYIDLPCYLWAIEKCSLFFCTTAIWSTRCQLFPPQLLLWTYNLAVVNLALN